jgi:S-adenosylmethionine:tRNA ribosyltransferase-isomerase
LRPFDYDLPDASIAQEPVEPRSAARLLVATDPAGGVEHRRVADLPELLDPGDLLVVNETRVLPARLSLHKTSGGAAEVLLLEPIPARPGWWEALVKPSKRLPPGTVLEDRVEIGDDLGDGRRHVRLLVEEAALEDVASYPLPPYIHRPLADPERYQTVYARQPGSVAAPTAGLHLTREVLDACAQRGIGLATVDLTVGLDTFRPVTEARLEDHKMHSERYVVPASTMEACAAAARVVAVGTTTVRALEAAAATGVLDGRTDLFIRDRYPFKVVDLLLTNFHLPKSTLLALVAAFTGDRWRDLYETALAEGYRFLSFGDAMLLARST